MRKRLGSLLLLVAACGTALVLAFQAGVRRETRPREPSRAAGPGERSPELVEQARTVPREGAETHVLSTRQAGGRPAEPLEEPEESAGTSAGGPVVRGVVRWDDGEPVPYLRLVAHGAGNERLVVVSDAGGRFESGSRLGPGRLRFRQMGEPVLPPGAVRHPAGLRFLSDTFLVPEDALSLEVEIVVARPPRRLDVEVVDRGAAPVAGARVTLEVVGRADDEGVTPGRGAWGAHDVWTRESDERGRVPFALYGVEGLEALGLFAEHRDPAGRVVRVSELRELELPLPLAGDLTERLVVDEAARLRVRARDEAGAPVEGLWIELEPGREPLFAWLPGGAATDAAGEVQLDGLPPRAFVVRADAASGPVRREVEVARGIEGELEWVLPEGVVPRLAVSGTVLDENGAPLPRVEVAVHFEGRPAGAETRATRLTDAQGRFEFHGAPCDSLTVRLDGSLEGDAFTPDRLSTSFGTQGLVFRRTERVPRKRLDLELVDALTGERLQEALVITVRAPGTSSYEFVSVVGGLTTRVVGAHPDVRLLVDSPGYRRRSVAPLELLRTEGAGSLHRIALERGLQARIEVRGRPEGPGGGRPLAGAEVRSGTRRVGVTDGSGRLTLDLDAWPRGDLEIAAPGHRPVSWSPVETLGDPGPTVVVLDSRR